MNEPVARPDRPRFAVIGLWILLAVVVGLGALWSAPLPDGAPRLAALPMKGLFYVSRMTPLTSAEEAAFRGLNVVRRDVVLRGRPLALTIIDGTRNRHAVHDPLFCVRGAGLDITGERLVPLEHGVAREVRVRGRDEQATVLFWFTDGHTCHASPARYWVQTTVRRLTRGASGPEPLLVLIVAPGAAAPAWETLLAGWPELTRL